METCQAMAEHKMTPAETGNRTNEPTSSRIARPNRTERRQITISSTTKPKCQTSMP